MEKPARSDLDGLTPMQGFVCYANKDARWLRSDGKFNLIPWLESNLYQHKLTLWYDLELRRKHAGKEFEEIIEQEIDNSEVAILLLSMEFTNSAFVRDFELPRIRKRVEAGTMRLIPVLVGKVSTVTEETLQWIQWIYDRQIIPDRSKPLTRYFSEPFDWDDVRNMILDQILLFLYEKRGVAHVIPGDALMPSSPVVSLKSQHDTEAPAEAGANYFETVQGCDLEMIWIEGGSFVMGSPEHEAARADDEKIQTLQLDGYWLAKYQVTQRLWKAIMGAAPSKFRKSERLPVESVSWNDAMEFCSKLSVMTGKKYSLPTDAQWEFGCRAGTRAPFCTGLTISTDQANFNGAYLYGDGREGVYRAETTEVGSFEPNPWGLYDMHGNVWEWCSDWYPGAFYSSPDPNKKPQGPPSGDSKVIRGGSWYDSPDYLRSAYRELLNPNLHTTYIGLRLNMTQ